MTLNAHRMRIFLIAVVLGIATAAPGRAQIDQPLNVIVILADDLGYGDLGVTDTQP